MSQFTDSYADTQRRPVYVQESPVIDTSADIFDDLLDDQHSDSRARRRVAAVLGVAAGVVAASFTAALLATTHSPTRAPVTPAGSSAGEVAVSVPAAAPAVEAPAQTAAPRAEIPSVAAPDYTRPAPEQRRGPAAVNEIPVVNDHPVIDDGTPQVIQSPIIPTPILHPPVIVVIDPLPKKPTPDQVTDKGTDTKNKQLPGDLTTHLPKDVIIPKDTVKVPETVQLPKDVIAPKDTVKVISPKDEKVVCKLCAVIADPNHG